MRVVYEILSIAHVFICIGLCGLILLQKTTGNGLFTSSSSNPFMSGVETSNAIMFLAKLFAIAFIVNTMVLASVGMRVSKVDVASEVIEKKQPDDYHAQIPNV